MDKLKDEKFKIEKIDFKRINKHKRQLLSLSRDNQIKVLKMAYSKGITVWFETSTIFLNESTDKGGIESSVIDNIFQDMIINSDKMIDLD